MENTQNAVSEKQNSGTPNLSLYEMYKRLYWNQNQNWSFIDRKKFLKLPYHERLRLAGAKIILLRHNSTLLKCYPLNVPILLPTLTENEIKTFDAHSTGVWLWGRDVDNNIQNTPLYVYPFEYQIIFESF